MIYNMILKMIKAESYNYDEILHKIETFSKNKRLTEAEVEELMLLLDMRHNQPVVLPELDEQ